MRGVRNYPPLPSHQAYENRQQLMVVEIPYLVDGVLLEIKIFSALMVFSVFGLGVTA